MSGHELLEEWRGVIESVISSAGSVASRAGVPRELLKATERQLELVQEILDRERRLQADLAERVLAPVDAIFELLEETGETLSRQAEALEAAGRALEETAGLMKHQAERFERTVGALRRPSKLAKAAAGVKAKPSKKKR